MIAQFMIWYLQKRGYLVLQNRVPMLVVSGGTAMGSKGKRRMYWQITFSDTPFIVAINNSVVS